MPASITEYKEMISDLSYDQFQIHYSNRNKADLADEQKQILKEENRRRVAAHVRFLSF